MPRPEFRVFIGKLPKTATEEEVQALCGANQPAEITLCSDAGWTYQFAIAFFHETSVAEAAVQTANGKVVDETSIFACELSKEEQAAKSIIVQNLPIEANEEMLQDIFNDYQPRDFGKRTEAWGFAVLRFSEANAALAATNDINGLSMGESVLQVRPRAPAGLAEHCRLTHCSLGRSSQVRWIGRAEEILLEKEIRRLKRAQYSAEAKREVVVGNLPMTASQTDLESLFGSPQSPFAPTSCDVKRNADGLSWGFAVLEFAESAQAWEVIEAMAQGTTLGEPPRELRVVKLYGKDKPKPKPPPQPPAEPKPQEPEPPKEPAPEAQKKKMMLMRKLKATAKVAGTASRVQSLTKAKINDPKMSLNNRIKALEEEVGKWANTGPGSIFKSLEARLMHLETELRDATSKVDAVRTVRGDEMLMESLRTFISDEGLGGSSEAPVSVDTEKIKLECTQLLMQELETIGLLIQGQDGAFEVSDAIMGSSVLALIEPLKDQLNSASAQILEHKASIERKLEKEELKTMCETVTGDASVALNPLLNIKLYVDEKDEEVMQSRADKASVDKRITALSKTLQTDLEEATSSQRAEVQEALSEVNSNVGGLEGKVEVLERDVALVKDKVSNDPLPALIEEQKKREKDIYEYIEGQMARFGLQQEDIARVTATLDEKPSEKQVRAMMASLHDKLQSKYGNSDAIAMMVESLKLDVRRKTTRDDVLRLVGASVKEMADQLKLPDDTLMAGRLQFRCLVCSACPRVSFRFLAAR